MTWLQGKVAVVTGSSSGIGAEIARALSAQGAAVVVNSRSSVREGKALAASLPNAYYAQGDVADPVQADLIVEEALRTFGHMDLLVNNAAVTTLIRHADLEAVTIEVWRDILDVNLIGAWNMVRAASEALRSTSDGSVINISSLAGVRPLGSSIPYAVSKAALNHLTLLLANTMGPEVRVNAIAPGLIATPWTERWPKAHAEVRAGVPLGRSGTVKDIADACVWLAGSRYTTGEIIVIDGGLHLRDVPLR